MRNPDLPFKTLTSGPSGRQWTPRTVPVPPPTVYEKPILVADEAARIDQPTWAAIESTNVKNPKIRNLRKDQKKCQ